MGNVNHPKNHKVKNVIEVIDVIENFELDYNEGVAVDCILRAKEKGSYLENLRKAIWHLERQVKQSDKAAGAEVHEDFEQITPPTPRNTVKVCEQDSVTPNISLRPSSCALPGRNLILKDLPEKGKGYRFSYSGAQLCAPSDFVKIRVTED